MGTLPSVIKRGTNKNCRSQIANNVFRIWKLKIISRKFVFSGGWVLGCAVVVFFLFQSYRHADRSDAAAAKGREEVVFWHFWGGEDRTIVDGIVDRFNDSQHQYFVRAIAMPGNNLQAKLFLAVAGGDPPDIVNQDDPVLADWAKRGVIQPLKNVAAAAEVDQVKQSLLAPARRLSVVDGALFAVCNGLDIRTLLYNQTAIDAAGLAVPQTIAQLDAIAEHFWPSVTDGPPPRLHSPVGYLPDSRRLWAWGPAFGADFYDPQTKQCKLDSAPVLAALKWMVGYSRRYGADNLASFGQGDQSLPGQTFPLLPVDDDAVVGRYVVIMDGQWRVRDVAAFQKRRADLGLPEVKFGACPLPVPTGGSEFNGRDANGQPQPQPQSQSQSPGRKDAGWVNGNFFVVPTGAKCSRGAWEFAKFWIGQSAFSDAESAADGYAQGGWIPVTREVAESATYRQYVTENPLMETFVRLASSPHQYPIPVVVGAALLKRAVENMTYDAMIKNNADDTDDKAIAALLKQRSAEVIRRLKVMQELTF